MRYCVHMRPQTSHMLNLKAVRSSVEMESFTLEIILQQESGYEAFSGVLEMNFEHLVLESGFFHTSKSCQWNYGKCQLPCLKSESNLYHKMLILSCLSVS